MTTAIAALRDGHARVRAGVVAALECLRNQGRDMAWLPPMLKDPDPNVREEAVRAGSVANWIAALADDSPAVRRAALSKLRFSSNGGSAAADPVTKLLADSDETIRNTAADVLVRLDPGLALARQMIEAGGGPASVVARALSRWSQDSASKAPPARFMNDLVTLWTIATDPSVESALSHTLVNWWPTLLPDRIAPALRDSDRRIRQRVAGLLRDLDRRSPRANRVIARKSVASELSRVVSEQDLERAADLHVLLILAARDGFEQLLLAALAAHGSLGMAGTFVNSGNASLSKAGSSWAWEHGRYIYRPSGVGTPTQWGGGE